MMTPENPRRRKTDQIFEGLTWTKVVRIATALTLVAGIAAGAVTTILAFVVTKPELKSVATKVDSIANADNKQFSLIKDRQEAADAVHRLLIPMATLECIRLAREKSSTLAVLANLPCDSLTRR